MSDNVDIIISEFRELVFHEHTFVFHTVIKHYSVAGFCSNYTIFIFILFLYRVWMEEILELFG